MLEKLKKLSKKSIVIRCIISFIIMVGCLVYSGMGLLQFIQGPKSLKNVDDIASYEGDYVSFDVEYIMSDYLWETSKNSKTGVESTTGMGYILYNYDMDLCFGFEIDTSDETKYDQFIEDTWNYINDQGNAPDSFVIKGTLKPIEGVALQYYNETVDEIFSDDFKNRIFPYYIDCDTLDGKDSFGVWGLTGVAAIALLFFIFNIMKANSNGYMKYLNKYLAANSNLSLATIEADFNQAEQVGKNIWVGSRWTIYMDGIYVKLIENSQLVWAYYYQRTGRHPESKIITYDINKSCVNINVSSSNADVILHNWSINQPHMMLGYDKDIEKTFRKDFDTFLNYKYNIAKSAASQQEDTQFSNNEFDYYSSEYSSSSEK